MRRPHLCVLLALPLLAAASVEVPPSGATLDETVAQAQSEAQAADAEVAKLRERAAAARTDAARLRAQQLAAAEAIAAAEARITAADAEMRLIAARRQLLRRQLTIQQRPVSALLGGLASMAQRPPLLLLARAQNPDELVQMRVLVDSTMPRIRARTASLRNQLSSDARLERATAAARTRLAQGRAEVTARRQEFAELEAKALAKAEATDAEALQAGDVALAATETADILGSEAQQARTGALVAAELARQQPPAGPSGAGAVVALRYTLPSQAPVQIGLGMVSPSGVRSRGVTFRTGRGAAILVPADGTIRFAGAFREYDGVVIIDHGKGWLSLIVNVATSLKPGDTVELGAPLGRALGPIEVELSRNGQRFSPSIIAGSSAPLSKGRQNH